MRSIGTAVSAVCLPLVATRQSKVTALTRCESLTWAVSVACVPGGGGLKVTLSTNGTVLDEKLSFRRPGEPAGRSTAGSREPAQFPGSWPEAKGQMRSSEAEWPSGAMGQGAWSEYLTASITVCAALQSSSFSPR